MKHKIIFGTIGALVIGTATAVPLGIILSDSNDDMNYDDQGIRDLSIQLDNLEIDKQNIENAINNLNNEQKTLAESLNALNVQLEDVLSEEEKIIEAESRNDAQIASLEAQKKILQDELTVLEEELSTLMQAQTDLNAAHDAVFAGFMSGVSSAERQELILKEREAVSHWKEIFNVPDTENPSSTGMTQIYNDEIARVSQEIDEKKAEIEILTKQQSSISVAISEVHNRVLDLSVTISDTEQLVNDLNNQIAEAQEKLDGVEDALEIKSDEKDMLEFKSGMISSSIASAQEAVDGYKEMFNFVSTTPGYENIDSINYDMFQFRDSQYTLDMMSLSSNQSTLNSFVSADLINANTRRISNLSDQSFFDHMTNIEMLYLPNVENIGGHAFNHSNKLTTIFIPNVSTIGYRAFEGVPNLSTTNVYLPSKFNNAASKNDIFGLGSNMSNGLGKWNNITFHWID